MNKQDAIRILGETTLLSPIGQAAYVAISALEKQIPKKPIEEEKQYSEDYGFNSDILCPVCNNYIGYYTEAMCKPEHMQYCNECGQRIDEMRSLIEEIEQLKSQLADYQDKNKLVLKVDITETDKFKTVAEQLAEAMELLKLSANFANNYSGWWSFQGYQDRYEKLKSEVEKNG